MDRNVNNEKWLYLPIEIKVRELEAKLLLTYYAVKENFRVIIGEHKIVEAVAANYPKGIFFSKGYPQKYRKRVIVNAKRHGHKIVEMDEEGLLINNKLKYLSDRMSGVQLENIEQEYCWGSFQKEMISTNYPQFSDKCFATGNPRFDLLKKKFRPLYYDTVKNLENNYGDFVLINTRFTRYNHFSGMVNENIVPSIKPIKALYFRFLEMIKNIADKFPELNFIVRPHPGENLNSYHRIFTNYKNVYVIRDGTVANWILASKLMIHNGCTTGIEAFLLGKPVLSYLPCQSKEVDEELPNKVSYKAYCIDEVHNFIKLMTTNLDCHKGVNELKQELSEYYGALDDQYASKNIIRLLHDININNDPLSTHPKEIHLSVKTNNKMKNRFLNLTLEEIQEFFTKIDHIEKSKNHFHIRKAAENLFEISNQCHL